MASAGLHLPAAPSRCSRHQRAGHQQRALPGLGYEHGVQVRRGATSRESGQPPNAAQRGHTIIAEKESWPGVAQTPGHRRRKPGSRAAAARGRAGARSGRRLREESAGASETSARPSTWEARGSVSDQGIRRLEPGFLRSNWGKHAFEAGPRTPRPDPFRAGACQKIQTNQVSMCLLPRMTRRPQTMPWPRSRTPHALTMEFVQTNRGLAVGGRGSTRWRGHARLPRVEEAICCELVALHGAGLDAARRDPGGFIASRPE